jgi:hypothetical protein
MVDVTGKAYVAFGLPLIIAQDFFPACATVRVALSGQCLRLSCFPLRASSAARRHSLVCSPEDRPGVCASLIRPGCPPSAGFRSFAPARDYSHLSGEPVCVGVEFVLDPEPMNDWACASATVIVFDFPSAGFDNTSLNSTNQITAVTVIDRSQKPILVYIPFALGRALGKWAAPNLER